MPKKLPHLPYMCWTFERTSGASSIAQGEVLRAPQPAGVHVALGLRRRGDGPSPEGVRETQNGRIGKPKEGLVNPKRGDGKPRNMGQPCKAYRLNFFFGLVRILDACLHGRVSLCRPAPLPTESMCSRRGGLTQSTKKRKLQRNGANSASVRKLCPNLGVFGQHKRMGISEHVESPFELLCNHTKRKQTTQGGCSSNLFPKTREPPLCGGVAFVALRQGLIPATRHEIGPCQQTESSTIRGPALGCVFSWTAKQPVHSTKRQTHVSLELSKWMTPVDVLSA